MTLPATDVAGLSSSSRAPSASTHDPDPYSGVLQAVAESSRRSDGSWKSRENQRMPKTCHPGPRE
jgi:hypothetical protein